MLFCSGVLIEAVVERRHRQGSLISWAQTDDDDIYGV
jgi:hypothetical protein